MPTEWTRSCLNLHLSKAGGGGGVRWRHDHVGCWWVASGRDGPGDPADRAFCIVLHRRWMSELVEHSVGTMVMQRVVGIALGYEDLNDHDQLRHDPVLAVLAGKLSSTRETCAPVAGKSTLNRLELSREEPTRYHK